MRASEVPRDLHYELGLLERIRMVSVNGTPLRDVPLFNEYAFWHRFEQFIFSSDIKRFAATKRFDEYKKGEGGVNFWISLKGLLVGLIGLKISFLAWIFSSLLRPQVIIFGIDRVSDPEYKADFRTHALYTYLKENNIAFVECLHTVFNAEFLKNFFARLRFAFYLESLDTLFAVIKKFDPSRKMETPTLGALESFSEEERRFVVYIIKKYLAEEPLVVFRVKMLTAFFKASKARAVWAIDDARYYHDIAVAGKRAHIPVYAFQHGHFTKYHTGWLAGVTPAKFPYIKPDYLMVWSEYWKKELLRLNSVFPAESIVESGYPDRVIQFTQQTSEGISVLVPHETDAPKSEVEKFLLQILASVPEANIVIKFRPDYSEQFQKDAYPQLPWNDTRLRYITKLSELTSRPTVVLGVYSSFLYDMVRAGVPVGILDCSMDYGKGMVENGLAELVRSESVAGDVRTISQAQAGELSRRMDMLGSGASFQSVLRKIAEHCGIGDVKTVG